MISEVTRKIEEWTHKWSNRYRCVILGIICIAIGSWSYWNLLEFVMKFVESNLLVVSLLLGISYIFLLFYSSFLVWLVGDGLSSVYSKHDCPICHARINHVKSFRWDGRDSDGKDIWIKVDDERF